MNQPLPQDDRFDGPPPDRRQPVFNMPGVVLALIAICVGVHLVRAYALGPAADIEVLVRFAFIPLRYSGQYAIDIYAWISPITYSFLHGDMVHLAVNMVWLAAFGSPLANRFGNLRFALFWAATALAAVGLGLVDLAAAPLTAPPGELP
jgi:membrane associated rhomboid family serine protease